MTGKKINQISRAGSKGGRGDGETEEGERNEKMLGA